MGGELQRTPADFLFQSKQKLPFNFKVILQDDETEIAEEDVLHLSTYSHSQSNLALKIRESNEITPPTPPLPMTHGGLLI